MRAGKNGNVGILNAVPDQEGEAVQYCAANVTVPSRINERSFPQSIQGSIEFDVEFCRQTWLLFFILSLSFRHIAFGRFANVDAITQVKRR